MFTAFSVHETKAFNSAQLQLHSARKVSCKSAISSPPSNKLNMKLDPVPSPLQQDLFHSKNCNLFARSHIPSSSYYSIKNSPSCLKGEFSLQKKPSSIVLLHPVPNQVVLDLNL